VARVVAAGGVLVGVVVLGVGTAAGAESCPVLSLAACPEAPPAPTTTTTVPPTTTTTAVATPIPTPAQARERLQALVNAERAQQGLAPLAVRADVTDIASRWSDTMAGAGTLSHDDAYFTKASHDRLDAVVLGENVARAGDIDQAHRALMASEHHRANILDARFTAVGFGATYVNGTWWLTEDFLQARANRAVPASAPHASAPRAGERSRVVAAPTAPTAPTAPVTTTSVAVAAVVAASVAAPAAVAVLPRADGYAGPARLAGEDVLDGRLRLAAVDVVALLAAAALLRRRAGRRLLVSA
jgi:uncharacterized protein YkwD